MFKNRNIDHRLIKNLLNFFRGDENTDLSHIEKIFYWNKDLLPIASLVLEVQNHIKKTKNENNEHFFKNREWIFEEIIKNPRNKYQFLINLGINLKEFATFLKLILHGTNLNEENFKNNIEILCKDKNKNLESKTLR